MDTIRRPVVMGPSGTAPSTSIAGNNSRYNNSQSRYGQPQQSRGGGLSNSHNPHDMSQVSEQENDAILTALMADIRTLKTTGGAISSELSRHNKIISMLETSFTQARGSLGKVMSKVDEVSGMNASKHMWLLILFAFGVFVFIYLLLKFKR